METFAQRGLVASSLTHCSYTGLHPSHRRLLVASFYVGRPYSVTIPTTWDAFTKNLWVPFPMLAWLLHRRCHARCCLRPRGVGWYSSITHLPFRLRPLGKDRHDPKISVSRGYGSDSELTPFTSLDSRISLYSWDIHYRAADYTLPGRACAFAFPRDAEPAPGSNPKRSQPWLFTNAALGGLKPAPASRLRGAKQPSSFAQLRTLYLKCARGALHGDNRYNWKY